MKLSRVVESGEERSGSQVEKVIIDRSIFFRARRWRSSASFWLAVVLSSKDVLYQIPPSSSESANSRTSSSVKGYACLFLEKFRDFAVRAFSVEQLHQLPLLGTESHNVTAARNHGDDGWDSALNLLARD